MLGSENGVQTGNQFSKYSHPFPDDQRPNHDQIALLKRPSAKSRDLMCVCWGGGVNPKIHDIYHPQTLHLKQPCITHTRCVSLSEEVT